MRFKGPNVSSSNWGQVEGGWATLVRAYPAETQELYQWDGSWRKMANGETKDSVRRPDISGLRRDQSAWQPRRRIQESPTPNKRSVKNEGAAAWTHLCKHTHTHTHSIMVWSSFLKIYIRMNSQISGLKKSFLNTPSQSTTWFSWAYILTER